MFEQLKPGFVQLSKFPLRHNHGTDDLYVQHVLPPRRLSLVTFNARQL